jgi:hypothetical protein
VIDSYNLKWINVYDLKGWSSSSSTLYNVSITPAFCLIDNKMKIILRTNYFEKIDAELKNIFKK